MFDDLNRAKPPRMSSSLPSDKQAKSEAIRQESFVKKRQLEKQRQSLIAEALKNVDSPASKSKKIVFNSDSEDENQTTSRAPVESSSNTQNNSNIRLFDNDGDEADEDNVELSIKNRHFGTKGAKLMALEAKFGNDERFRMNEKFLDEDNTKEEEVDGEAMELAKEKKTEFEILSKVLGRTIRSTKLNENAVASSQKKAPFLRFDPDNPTHVQWLNEQQQLNHAKDNENNDQESSDDSVGEEDERNSVEQDESEETDEALATEGRKFIEGYYYDFDQSFAESLKNSLKIQNGTSTETDNKFSFLKSVGRAHSSSEDEMLPLDKRNASNQIPSSCSEEAKSSPVNRDSVKKLEDEPQGETSLEKEEPGEPKRKHVKASAQLPTDLSAATTSLDDGFCFFLRHTDPQIANSVQNFCRKQSVESIKKNWSNIRTSIVKIYKGQRKQALRQKKEEEKQAMRSINSAKNASKKTKLNNEDEMIVDRVDENLGGDTEIIQSKTTEKSSSKSKTEIVEKVKRKRLRRKKRRLEPSTSTSTPSKEDQKKIDDS